MKVFLKIIIWVMAVFFVLFVVAGIGVALYGKKIIVAQIEKKVNAKVSLQGVGMSLPFSLNLDQLQIGEFFKVDQVRVSFPIKITLVDPVINLEQSQDGKLNLPEIIRGQKSKKPAIILTALCVKNGKIIFTDKTVSPDGYKTIAERISADISKEMMPLDSLKVNFKISANIMDGSEQALGSMDFSGWLDWEKKDMDAVSNIKNMEVTHFQPYYGNFFSERKLLSAKLNLTSKFDAKNNDLKINNNFQLSKIVYAQQQETQLEPGQLPDFDFKKRALDLFTDRNGNLNLEFTLTTKLDRPRFNKQELKDVMLEAAQRNLANQPPQDVAEKIYKTIQDFKDFGKQMEDIFKNKQ